MLNEISRTLNPLDNITVAYTLQAPLEAPELANYRERLERGLASAERAISKGATISPVATVGFYRLENGQIVSASLLPNSPLLPRSTETIAYYLLLGSGLRLEFYNPPKFINGSPDLMMEAMPHDGQTVLEYDFVTHSLTISAFGVPADVGRYISNAHIISVPDIAGLTLALRPEGFIFPFTNPNGTVEINSVTEKLSRVRTHFRLRWALLSNFGGLFSA
jgi:hypothetical protein